jgi:5'-3' exonuclease
MKKEYNKWNGTHTVFYIEGHSWRKKVYPDYKGNRPTAFALQTQKEQEDHGILVEAFDSFVEYLDKKTNITVLQNLNAEADDMIAVFVEAHPDDKHIIISSDSDFFQLLKFPNVMLYDPVKDIQIRQDGVFDDDGNRLEFILDSNAKLKAGKKNPDFECEKEWYNYALFLKCVRGDKTDYIFSAYPGVREKGTKTSVGIREAYNDRDNRGYSWNNFMQQKWVDHESAEQVVKNKYEFNRSLIDLSLIPDNIKTECLQIIAEETDRKSVPAVEIGMGFMKYCGTWALKKIGDNSTAFMPMLRAKYNNEK